MRGLADRLSRLVHRYENLRLARHMLALSFRAAPLVAVVNIVLILLFAGGTALAALAQRQLVDAAGRHAMAAVLVAALLGVLAHAESFALSHVQGEVRQDLTVRVARELDHEVLGLTARIPTIEHLERPEFLDRLTALRRGTQALAASVWRAALGAASLLSLVLSVVLLAGIHPALALLVLCALPTVVMAGRGRAYYRSVLDACTQQDRLERELHALCLKPEPAKEVRIAGSGPVLDRRARALWDDTSRRLVRARARAVAYEAAGWLVFVAALTAALAYALHLHARDQASLGDLVLLLSLALALSNQIANVLFNLGSVADAGHVTRHYLWLHTYAETTARADGHPAPERLEQGIQLRGLTFAYPGADGTPILSDVDLDLPAGSTLGLVGINGAGKSTLVKLLTGMYEPTAGEIRVDGTPLSSLAPASWSARCSGTLQDFAKLEFLARESVGVGDLPRIEDRDAVAGAVERAGARPLVDGHRLRGRRPVPRPVAEARPRPRPAAHLPAPPRARRTHLCPRPGGRTRAVRAVHRPRPRSRPGARCDHRPGLTPLFDRPHDRPHRGYRRRPRRRVRHARRTPRRGRRLRRALHRPGPRLRVSERCR
ncbi:ATP-binding cassette domain-containing protein [Streptomyces sp. NPDC000851]